MKILIVLHKIPKKGGMVLQLLKMSKEFRRRGHKVIIFSFDKFFNNNHIKDYLNIYRNFRLTLDTFNPSIILTSNPFITSTISIIARRRNAPIVIRMGAVYDSFYSAKVVELLSPQKIHRSIFFFINGILKIFEKLVLSK